MVISILYSSLLHYIKQFDTTIAYALHNADKGGAGAARRESRRESLIPPIPNSYQTVEGGGGNSRAGM
jgi:copper transporter 1